MKRVKPIVRSFCTSSSIRKLKRVSKNLIPINAIEELHAKLIRTQLHTDPFSISRVIKSYASSHSHLHKAHLAFNQIRQPTLLVWNYMIRGISLSDQPYEAIDMYNRLYSHGLVGDNLTFIFVLKACARVSDIVTSRKIHACGMKLGFGSYLYVSNALMYAYASCSELGFAQKLFDEMCMRDFVSWNSLICGYSQCGRFDEVLRLFNLMQEEDVKADSVTMVKVILACSYLGKTDTADFVMKYIENNQIVIDVYLGNSLIDMYGMRGLVDSAREVFESMNERNIVTWNTMIKGYVKAEDMIKARQIFCQMPRRDVISWTTMITAYCRSNLFGDAVKLFREMMLQKVKPDKVTVASIFSACAHLGSIEVGQEIHDYICKHDLKTDVYVGNALIDVYCKCGDVHRAKEVFYEMKEKDSISWTSLISGLAVNGFPDSALGLFSEMLAKDVRPISSTFVGILLACAHAGLVDKGLALFERMSKSYGLEPEMKHHGCVVDLLSRSGNLDRAYEFIETMPMKPDVVLWRTLLSACKIHGNVGMARIVGKKLLESDPSNSGNYILLSNAYAGFDQWDQANRVREMMSESHVKKPTGSSFIEDDGRSRTPK